MARGLEQGYLGSNPSPALISYVSLGPGLKFSSVHPVHTQQVFTEHPMCQALCRGSLGLSFSICQMRIIILIGLLGALNIILSMKRKSGGWTGAWGAGLGAGALLEWGLGDQQGRERGLGLHCFPNRASASLLVWILKLLAQAGQAFLFLSSVRLPQGGRLQGPPQGLLKP